MAEQQTAFASVRTQSIDKPGDPLMDFMRREGLLMAPRFCNNGSLLPADMANSPIDLAAGPLFLANSTDEVLRGLANATALAPLQEAAQVNDWWATWAQRSRAEWGAQIQRMRATCT